MVFYLLPIRFDVVSAIAARIATFQVTHDVKGWCPWGAQPSAFQRLRRHVPQQRFSLLLFRTRYHHDLLAGYLFGSGNRTGGGRWQRRKLSTIRRFAHGKTREVCFAAVPAGGRPRIAVDDRG